ncbi:MAG TPA: anthranilate phosphoribosyltransferase [Nitrososphaeraceae archaeon]
MNSYDHIDSVVRSYKEGKYVPDHEFKSAIESIFAEDVSDKSIASLLLALNTVTIGLRELKIIRKVLLHNSIKITPKNAGIIIDNCGTGGDLLNTFNISTAASIIIASAGCSVAKHGNRSSSGMCGSADFFEFIGLDLSLPVDNVAKGIEKIGIAFLFAPQFHPKLRRLAAVRKQLGIKTIFNIIGPLCNPCTNLFGQVIGISDAKFIPAISSLMSSINNNSILVRSNDGLDELSNTSNGIIVYVKKSNSIMESFNPNDVGIKLARIQELQVNSFEDSIRATLKVIYGKAKKPLEDIVVLNSAIGLVVGEKAKTLADGIAISRDLIISKKAVDKLSELISMHGNINKLIRLEHKYNL